VFFGLRVVERLREGDDEVSRPMRPTRISAARATAAVKKDAKMRRNRFFMGKADWAGTTAKLGERPPDGNAEVGACA